MVRTPDRRMMESEWEKSGSVLRLTMRPTARSKRVRGARACREPELAARDSPSSDTFSKRCQKLAVAFDAIFEDVDAAFAEAPTLPRKICSGSVTTRSNFARQRAWWGLNSRRSTSLPLVSVKNQILPRVLAIAQSFFLETNMTSSKSDFTDFCRGFRGKNSS